MSEKFCIKTYGCQMNVADSERIRSLLLRDGYRETADMEEANLIILNTCAVRKHAEDRALARLSSLKHYKRKNPNLIIGLFGCIPSLYGEKLLKEFPHLSILCGPKGIGEIISLLQKAEKGEQVSALQIATCRDSNCQTRGLDKSSPYNIKNEFFDDRCILTGKKKAAFLPIMQGCDKYCSYCVVPYTRGRERSKPSLQIMEEVENLVRQGVREIMLLGQNVNSYGKGLAEKIDFAGLLKLVGKIEDLEKIKFMTSHPKDISQDLLEVIASSKKIEKRLHLPVQSGSDSTLEKMNRGYTVKDYKKIIENARELMPKISISTDIIVGFPGEKEEDFQQTLKLLTEIRFDSIFAFKYSNRPKTAAVRFSGQIPQEEKERRLKEILELQRKINRTKGKAAQKIL